MGPVVAAPSDFLHDCFVDNARGDTKYHQEAKTKIQQNESIHILEPFLFKQGKLLENNIYQRARINVVIEGEIGANSVAWTES
jgi:hypothetical protein